MNDSKGVTDDNVMRCVPGDLIDVLILIFLFVNINKQNTKHAWAAAQC